MKSGAVTMKTLKFYGVGDDVFVCQCDGGGCSLNREADGFSNGAAYLLKSGDGQMTVFGQYACPPVSYGSWSVGVSLAEDGIQLPSWPLRIETAEANGFPNPRVYSPMIIIECPDDITVVEI